MKKKQNRQYIINRAQYKAAKSYDHRQFDDFCSNIYMEGFKDGEKSVQAVDITAIMEAIKSVKGIGNKRMAQIEASLTALLEKKDGIETENKNAEQ